jgi:DNA-binding phage protein
MTTVPWEDGLSETFRDPEFIKEYLHAAWEEGGTSGVASALKHVAEVARKRSVGEQTSDIPLGVVSDTLRTLGLELSVSPAT